MRSVVVYESDDANTRLIAEAIAQGLGCAPALAVPQAGDQVREAQLVVVGGATELHGLARTAGRRAPATGRQTRLRTALSGPGLREWLRGLPRADGVYAAAFDTRLDKPRWVSGDAARSIARRLANNGYEVLGAHSFLVEDTDGPLRAGERERARAFGERLARSLSTPAPASVRIGPLDGVGPAPQAPARPRRRIA